MDSSILVWDLRNTSVPVYTFNSHKKGDAAQDFFWASGEHVISCGKDATVQLHGFSGAHRPLRGL